ncbi:hypothetical protein AVEN_163638-1 [Araneus ventricosus]|uniref:Uncharacterized protein n=1 Tax=Araneus ventricosus TaxID=182803 RepID=A0A4Y2MTN8_ARAVE|nr:hypothetical protein AVEN_163638-1 [Araneus ventricosus]
MAHTYWRTLYVVPDRRGLNVLCGEKNTYYKCKRSHNNVSDAHIAKKSSDLKMQRRREDNWCPGIIFFSSAIAITGLEKVNDALCRALFFRSFTMFHC